jgi:hypothetical protein
VPASEPSDPPPFTHLGRVQGSPRRTRRPHAAAAHVDRLGARATLRVIEHADHSFHVLKQSGRTDEQVLDELTTTAAE